MRNLLIPLVLLPLISACTLFPPSAEETANLPKVRFGEAAPAGKPFILHYPAGAPLPVKASVSGSLFTKPDEANLAVALKRDLYVYKEWASFDGQKWCRGTDLVGGNFEITLPGEPDGNNPGRMSAQFNLKE